MEALNSMNLKFKNKAENEFLARTAVTSFLAYKDPTLSWLSELKTAVSEAVSNAIIHAYDNFDCDVFLNMDIEGDKVHIEVIDNGCGISDIESVKLKNFTTRKDIERAGMGFSIMETFVDTLKVETSPGMGTKIILEKKF